MIDIRIVKQEDLESLARIYSNSFTQACPEKPWEYDRSLDFMNYWFKKQPDLFYVALFNGVVIGATVLNIKPWREGNRCQDAIIFVDSKYQKQGIGKMLFVKVLEESISKYNATTFEAVTFTDNEFPLSWYERIGVNKDEKAAIIKGSCKNILKNLKSN